MLLYKHIHIYITCIHGHIKSSILNVVVERERERERGKKTGIDEQVKNLSKLIYIKIASHENIHKLLFNCHFLAKITAYISLIGYV